MKPGRLFILIALFFVFDCHYILAQRQLGKPTWEIGTDLLWLVGKENIPISIFVKNHRNKLKKGEFKTIKYAYRMRFGLDINKQIDGNAQIYIPNTTHQFYSNIKIYLRPGYEVKKVLNSFEVFFGMDLPINYVNSNGSAISFVSGAQQKTESTSKGMSFGIAPVAGISYTLAKNIKFTLESSLDILYSTGYRKDKMISPNANLLLDKSWNEMIFIFFPIQTINISVLM